MVYLLIIIPLFLSITNCDKFYIKFDVKLTHYFKVIQNTSLKTKNQTEMKKHIFIILLKGINVGGNNKIKMSELKDVLLKNESVTQVKTYIQSGNIIIESLMDLNEIIDYCKTSIQLHFELNIDVFGIEKSEWLRMTKVHPFSEETTDHKVLHVTFFMDAWKKEDLTDLLLLKPENEHIEIKEKHWFLYYPDGYGKSKFNHALFQRKLKTSCTSRNWRTIQKITDLLEVL